MSAGPAVPREAAPVRREWPRLAVTTAEPPRFDPLMITALLAGNLERPARWTEGGLPLLGSGMGQR